MTHDDHAAEFRRVWTTLRPSLLKFAGELAEPLTPADAGRMYLAAATMALGSQFNPAEIADMLRQLADQIGSPRAVAH